MGLTLREVRDEDLPLLFEHWADPLAVRVIATERNVAEARSAEIEELVLRLDELASPIGADHSPFGR